MKRKNELSKISRKKIDFSNSLKYAEIEIFRTCIDVYIKYEDKVYDEINEVLSEIKEG